MNVKLIMAVVREHVWTHGHHSSVNVMMGTLWQQMGAVVKIWMSVLWAHIVASSSVSTVMDLMAVTVKRAMPSTVMEEHAGFPVVGTTQPTMAASTLLAGQPTTLWTSAASGTSTQKTPPQTISYLSPSTTALEYTGVLLVARTTCSFTMEAQLQQHHWVSFVF
jgi:hypothetical protein